MKWDALKSVISNCQWYLTVVKLKWNILHLWTFKTPTSWAVMSDNDDADWALSVPNGVKKSKLHKYQPIWSNSEYTS